MFKKPKEDTTKRAGCFEVRESGAKKQNVISL
jgi:hypothetical protein